MAVRRNDRVNCVLLHRVKISNLYILDLTLEATSDSSADMKIPITAHINVKL